MEVDAIPELVLGAEIAFELMVPLDGQSPWPSFRTAVEGAYRVDELGLVGLRAQAVADIEWRDPLVLLDPFLRVGWLEPVAGLVVHVSVPVVLQPSTASGPLGGLWSVGLQIGAGAVF